VVLRLVLAEDSYLMREGIRASLALDEDLDLVAACGSYDELIPAVDQHHPDVVLTDIRMPPTQTDEGIRAANLFRDTHPGIGVVVLSQYVEPDYAVRLFADGSDGRAYLLKERVGDIDELAGAIRRVAEGGSVLDPKVVDALIEGRSRDESSVLGRLTDREREVLAHVVAGRTYAEIAAALFLSEKTVSSHISNILHKTGTANRAELAAWATRRGAGS